MKNNISKSSEEVIQNVLNAIQPLEELGGPLLPEYIEVMDKIIHEIGMRKENARILLSNSNPDNW